MIPAKDLLAMLNESQRWDAARMESWQRRQLFQLINHARATVPFYRFRLNRLFRPDGTIDWAKWRDLPILTRRDVSENFEQLVSRAPVREHGRVEDVSSSGSTGHPVTVRTTGWLNMLSGACNWRAHGWEGLDFSKPMLGVLGPQNRRLGEPMGPWGPPWLPGAKSGQMLYSAYDSDNHARLEIIRRSKVRYLATTLGIASMLAETARSEGNAPPLDVVLMRGNKTTPFVRQEMQDVFGARVVELYSSKECGAIAHPCPDHGGWHVNAEAVLLEVLDDNDQPVKPGEEGRAVITPFGMTAFPLIRYDQGDRIVQGDTCACGRTLPHFHAISGRVRDDFSRPDGSVIPDLPIEARKILGAGRWQVAQVGPDAYEIRYVARDWGVPRDEAKFRQIFADTFYPEARLTLVEMSDIALGGNGKFKERVQEWKG